MRKRTATGWGWLAAVVVVGSLAASPVLAATFAASAGSLGAIADGNSVYGAPRDVTFTVSGLLGTVTNVEVDLTLTHTWVGDLDMVLMAPGGAPSLVLASRIGATTDTGFGDSSDFGGTYGFDDDAVTTNIWTVALVALSTEIVTPATYRTTAGGGAGQTNPAPVTSLNMTFAGMSSAAANGTWTLRVRDRSGGDTGSVTAANLTVEASLSAGDIDGNGQIEPLTDGLLFLRYAFGFRGSILINAAVAGDCTRCTANDIETYIQSTFY